MEKTMVLITATLPLRGMRQLALNTLPPPQQSPTTVHVHLIIPSQNFSPPRTTVESASDLERFHLLFFGGYLSHFCLSLVPWGG